MKIEENVSLASRTTLRVGGGARYFIQIEKEGELSEALLFAKEKKLPWCVLGWGSNVLAPQEGYEGVVITIDTRKMRSERDGDHLMMYADAGVSWEEVVREAAKQEAWGVENLAGIPGTVGAAPVQNIGAYGTELKDTLSFVRVFDSESMESKQLSLSTCAFGYRDSMFKRSKALIIMEVGLMLRTHGTAYLSYPDLRALSEAGADLSTPHMVGEAVRAVRAKKFPDMRTCGTAGSFFKNPIVSKETYEKLLSQYPELPGFSHGEDIKIPLAYILDRILMLKGYTQGFVRLYEAQPLVVVTSSGARAHDVEVLRDEIKKKVYDATSIVIQEEVQTLRA